MTFGTGRFQYFSPCLVMKKLDEAFQVQIWKIMKKQVTALLLNGRTMDKEFLVKKKVADKQRML